jgi:predicted RND superfamily exporter protein
VLTAVAAAVLGGLAALRVDTQPKAFLPVGDPSVQELQQAARSFGADPIVVLAESGQPGQLLGPDQLPRLLELEGRLAQLPDVAVVYGPATVLNQIAISSQNLLASLSGYRDAARAGAQQQARASGATAQAAADAGDAAVDQFDLHYGALLARGLPAGLPTLHNPAFVNRVVFGDDGFPRPQWRFVVPAPNSVAVLVRPRENLDQQATDRLVGAVVTAVRTSGLRTQRVTVTGSPSVAAALAKQVRREMPLLAALAVALIAACYLMVPWLGRVRHRLLPVAATLGGTASTLALFGWLHRPMSLGAMAFLPILVGVGSDFPAYLIQRGDQRRVLVAALASALGFASLAVSPLPFVRDLGLALALGVLLAVGIAALLRRRLPHAGEDPVEIRTPAPAPPARGFSRRAAAAGLAVLVAGAGWAMLPRLELQAQPEQLAQGLPAINDAARAEQILGSTGEVQLVLSGPNTLSPAALGWMRRAEDNTVIEYGSQLRPILSLPDLLAFLGPSPSQEEIDAGAQLLPGYLVGAVATHDGKKAVISFGIKFQDLASQQRLIDDLRVSLPPLPAGYRADVAGLPVVAAHGYQLISGNRYLANLLGILAAGLVLLLGLRRRSDAVRAVVAAALATGWGLAATAALGIPLTPLTVALGPLTTATACEFTVLLADAHRRNLSGQRRTVAVAALAAAVGYATLAASSLSMIREFGLLLSATVLLSLFAAHLVLLVLPHRPARTKTPGQGAGAVAAEPDAPAEPRVEVNA